MPTISVVIPAYNASRTILETIRSVQQQTFSDFEVILINDGSTDDLLERLNAVVDTRLKVFSYPNAGLPTARNRGIKHAKGEFITFLDADDLWAADKLELQLQALQTHPKAGVAYSWTCFMDEQGQSYHLAQPIFFEGNVLADLLVRNFLASGSNPMIRTAAIASVGAFDPDLKSCEDWDYWLRLAEQWEFVVVPKPQIYYRKSASSMSAKVERMEQCQLEVIGRAFDRVSPELRSLKNQSLANIYQYSAQLYLMYGSEIMSVQKARSKLWLSMRLYPWIVLQRKTQALGFKLLFLSFLPSTLSRILLRWISDAKAKPI